MKSFREQMLECKNESLLGHSEPMRYADHPEWLPAFWHPATPKFKKALEENPNLTFTKTLCLRFGGDCNSGHPKCKELRNQSTTALKQTIGEE